MLLSHHQPEFSPNLAANLANFWHLLLLHIVLHCKISPVPLCSVQFPLLCHLISVCKDFTPVVQMLASAAKVFSQEGNSTMLKTLKPPTLQTF